MTNYFFQNFKAKETLTECRQYQLLKVVSVVEAEVEVAASVMTVADSGVTVAMVAIVVAVVVTEATVEDLDPVASRTQGVTCAK